MVCSLNAVFLLRWCRALTIFHSSTFTNLYKLEFNIFPNNTCIAYWLQIKLKEFEKKKWKTKCFFFFCSCPLRNRKQNLAVQVISPSIRSLSPYFLFYVLVHTSLFLPFPAYFYRLCFHSSVRYTLISLPRFTPAVQFSAAYLDVKHFSLVIRLLRLHDLAKSKETLVVGKNIQMVIPTCEVKLS